MEKSHPVKKKGADSFSPLLKKDAKKYVVTDPEPEVVQILPNDSFPKKEGRTISIYEAETIRELRCQFESMRNYLDDEIAHAYSLYCETFHGAAWTKVNLEEFVKWATSSPLDSLKQKFRDELNALEVK
jgi:hypothetical protein